MSYYPKSQIQSNLYTNGEEFTTNVNSNVSYKGFYWKTSRGEFFTGKSPQDIPNEKLYKIQLTDKENTTPTININYITSDNTQGDISDYVKLKKVNSSKMVFLPTYSPNIPTEQDYKIGEYRRYFCKKTNEITYLEINKDTYDKLVNQDSQILYQLYFPFNISWKLTGTKEDVYKTNKNIVELKSFQLKLPMLSEYLKNDFTKYYR